MSFKAFTKQRKQEIESSLNNIKILNQNGVSGFTMSNNGKSTFPLVLVVERV